MIITDGVHLVSTVSEKELHEFAAQLGLKRRWYQNHPRHPHYDMTAKRTVVRALRLGAQIVTSPYLIHHAWWAQPAPEEETR